MSILFFGDSLVKRKNSFCSLRKLLRVLRCTFNFFAILTFVIPFVIRLLICSLYQSSFFLLFMDHKGRPSFLPSAFLFIKASLVLWLIKFLSISAESPKAKAKTLLWISSQSLYQSLIVRIFTPLFIQRFKISMIIKSVLPNLDNSEQIIKSLFLTLWRSLPNFLLE